MLRIPESIRRSSLPWMAKVQSEFIGVNLNPGLDQSLFILWKLGQLGRRQNAENRLKTLKVHVNVWRIALDWCRQEIRCCTSRCHQNMEMVGISCNSDVKQQACRVFQRFFHGHQAQRRLRGRR
jgi:hypothetical protein